MEKYKDFDKKAFAQKGKHIYRQKYAKKLEPTERGRIIAIEVESGDSFIGDSTVEAILKAKEKYPDKIFYLMRVGYDAVHSSKGFVPVLEANDAKDWNFWNRNHRLQLGCILRQPRNESQTI